MILLSLWPVVASSLGVGAAMLMQRSAQDEQIKRALDHNFFVSKICAKNLQKDDFVEGVVWLENQSNELAVSICLSDPDVPCGLTVENADEWSLQAPPAPAYCMVALEQPHTEDLELFISGECMNGNFLREVIPLTAGSLVAGSRNKFRRIYSARLLGRDLREVSVHIRMLQKEIGLLSQKRTLAVLWMGKKVCNGRIVPAEGGDIPDRHTGLLLPNIRSGELEAFGLRFTWMGQLKDKRFAVHMDGLTTPMTKCA